MTARNLAALAIVLSCLTACQPLSGAPSTATPPTTAINELSSLRILDTLPNIPGYQRGCNTGQRCSFGPAWSDNTDAPGGHNGCDTRNDILRTQLTNISFKAGSRCVVTAGVLDDPYTGRTINWNKANAGAIQIDHVVPLHLAWRLGAATWTQTRRDSYANDETNVLLAADGTQNEIKGDSGPARWMPPNTAFACSYAQKFVHILAVYQLPVVSTDRAALAAVLRHCSNS